MDYDALKGIDWAWLAMDGAMTKAPLGGEKDGQKPHRPRQERHQTQPARRRQRRPVGLAVDGANRPDCKMVRATIESIAVDGPNPRRTRRKGCAWTKRMSATTSRTCPESFTSRRTSGPRAKKPRRSSRRGCKARRWVVERTHSWMNRFRGMLIRWNKKACNHWGFCIWRVPISRIQKPAD